jgi:hypothetical protein
LGRLPQCRAFFHWLSAGLDLVLGFLGGWAYAGYAFAKLVQPGVVAAGGLWGASELLKFYFLAEFKN